MIAPIAASASVFPCRVCGEALLYARVFAISKAFRAAGRRAVKADMICEGCEAFSAGQLGGDETPHGLGPARLGVGLRFDPGVENF